MPDYLREHSFGEIIRNVFAIYRSNFFTIVTIYAIPTILLVVLGVEFGALLIDGSLSSQETTVSFTIAFLLLFFFLNLINASMAVAMRDICRGNKPNPLRAYSELFRFAPGKLLLTTLLQFVIMTLGFSLFILPGIFFYFWFIFITTIVVTEKKLSSIGVFWRSKQLGDGYHFRSCRVALVMICFYVGLSTILYFAFTLLIIATEFYIALDIIIGFVCLCIQILLGPIPYIAIVLMYYDLRARKEGLTQIKLADEWPG